MKISVSGTRRFLDAPPRNLRVVLFHGSDPGLVRTYSGHLARSLGFDQKGVETVDPERVIGDPAGFVDDALTPSLLAGERLIRIRSAGDAVADTLKLFLERVTDEMVIVVEADELKPGGKLRKLAEGDPRAASIGCYPQEGRSREGMITELLNAEGLDADRRAHALLSATLPMDRQGMSAGITALSLYLGRGGKVDEDTILKVLARNAEARLDQLADATATGRVKALGRIFDSLWETGHQPVQIARALARHFERLLLLKVRMAEGMSFDQAASALKPPIFFKREAYHREAVALWSGDELARAIALCVEIEAMAKSGLPQPELHTEERIIRFLMTRHSTPTDQGGSDGRPKVSVR